MKFVDQWRSVRLIGQWLEQPDEARRTVTLAALKSIAQAAVVQTCKMLPSAPHYEADALTDLLAQLALGLRRDQIRNWLNLSDPLVGEAVCRAYEQPEKLGPAGFLDLMADLAVPGRRINDVLKARVREMDAVDLLGHACKARAAERASLMRILGDMVDSRLEAQLLSRLDSRDLRLRVEIIRLIARLDTSRSLRALQKLLDDPEKLIRKTALECLLASRGKIDLPLLCGCLMDEDLSVQALAVDTIIARNSPETVNYLLEPLRHDSEHVRRSAVEVLNGIADLDSVRSLLSVIQDRDWWVRSRTADALGRIGGPRVIAAVLVLLRDDDTEMRRTAIEIINSAKDPATYDGLLKALEDSDWWVRERAVDGLAAIGDKRAAPILSRMLDRVNFSDPFFTTLLRALSKLGAEEFLASLRKRLADRPVNMSGEARELLNAVRTKISKASPPQTAADGKSNPDAGDSSHAAGGAASDTDTLQDVQIPAFAMVPKVYKKGDMVGGRYIFLHTIGSGAYGSVYLAEDSLINERVVLKLLLPQFVANRESIKRLIQELRCARQVSHPNIVRIFDMAEIDGGMGIVMEYFESETLALQIERSRVFEQPRALAVVAQICSGMDAVHREGVVHRDLKPGNVLINSLGEVKVVDFGIAEAADHPDLDSQRSGLMLGTPRYMSPEQVLGAKVDARTDIYSLGVMLYEMLCGKAPHESGDAMETMVRHLNTTPTPALFHKPKMSVLLNDIIMRAIQTRPENRFPSMDAFRQALSQVK